MKPHHFLDIIKLFGAGREQFIPDEKFRHDFWKVGNLILENKDLEMELTIGNDAICVPCKYNDGEKCSDMTMINSNEISKDEFNKMIDQRLLEKLQLKVGSTLSAIEYCQLANEKLTKEDIFEIWRDKPREETERRVELLFAGIKKYLASKLIH